MDKNPSPETDGRRLGNEVIHEESAKHSVPDPDLVGKQSGSASSKCPYHRPLQSQRLLWETTRRPKEFVTRVSIALVVHDWRNAFDEPDTAAVSL
jgi:hypothetical protein